jgi:hypothetical protein
VDRRLAARLFSADTDAWNDERYVLVGAPALGVVGVLIGAAIAIPLGLPILQRVLVYVGCSLIATAIGLPVLALSDARQVPNQ